MPHPSGCGIFLCPETASCSTNMREKCEGEEKVMRSLSQVLANLKIPGKQAVLSAIVPINQLAKRAGEVV